MSGFWLDFDSALNGCFRPIAELTLETPPSPASFAIRGPYVRVVCEAHPGYLSRGRLQDCAYVVNFLLIQIILYKFI